ncbi:4'-phosphopantetheinyl transferase family protein [Corynebacterium liangguodongii]|uniref:4'-phosphopantetheinyl transferase n=1 Tax=Corynebacterium liangguodongii TaxID=2079535 RepID=A0A2S0WEM5_9CORY|nr:4'-phosphopantetheinyl transferase superfamily protein [Corynebacterium liangguodongii]AWB84219.1 4'-phosphopantetheinyl transferase [Corynebacterium liangguodongii]PWC00229.1 4'-phosphopantetheinyl transferase [Corynebacterium liangguodongii]
MQAKDLFPPSARFVYLRTGDDGDLSNYLELHPEERSLVARAVDKRKGEFGDARWCAHRALAELGVPPGRAILKGDSGMPLWPEGFVGSLSHTEGLRAAVAAPASQLLSVGLDVEPAEALPEGVIDQISRSGERHRIDAMQAGGAHWAGRLLFSAKEATYKCWFPLTRRWLGFEDAEIDIRADGTFIAYILARPTPAPLMYGRWVVRGGYVFASAFLERAS